MLGLLSVNRKETLIQDKCGVLAAGTKMPRYKIRYPQQRDPAEEARKQAAEQRQAQASAYAAAKFQEWQADAPEREQELQLRIENLQSEAELKGAQFKYNFWKDQELRRQTTAYYTAMPALQESLRQAGIYPGSQRYAAEISAFAAELPDAVTHNEAIRNDLKQYAKVDEDAARINQMMAAQGLTRQEAQIQNLNQTLANQGLRSASFSTTAQGGVDVKSTRPIDEGLKSLNLSPTEFLHHVNAKQGKFDEQGKFTQSLSPGEQANAIQFQAGSSKTSPGQLVTHAIPLTQFNEFRENLGVNPLPAYVASQAGVATPSPTPEQITNQPEIKHLGRYNPETGEYE